MAKNKKRASRHKRRGVTGDSQRRDRGIQLRQAAVRARAEGVAAAGMAPSNLSPDVAARLEATHPGLAARLAEGLTADELGRMAPEIAQALSDAGAGPGRHEFGAGQSNVKLVTGTQSGKDLPYGMQSGDIISQEQPLGYVETDIALPGGGSIPKGSKVYRAAPGTPVDEVIDIGAPAPLGESRTAIAGQPRLARGHAGRPPLIITDDREAAMASDADLVIEDLDDTDDDSGRVLMGSAAQIRAYHQRENELAARVARLVPSRHTEPAMNQIQAEAVQLRTQWPHDAVLDTHAWLRHHYRDPGADLTDYLTYLITEAIRQDHRAASDYWPVVRTGPHDPPDLPQGRQLGQLLSRGLGDALTYQVEAPMCRKLRADWEVEGSPRLLADAARHGLTPLLLSEGELPAPAGFAWLDAPWLIQVDQGYWLAVRAVSWERDIIPVRDETSGVTVRQPSVRVMLWLLLEDEIAFGRTIAEGVARTSDQIGRLVPQQLLLLPFGVPVRTVRKHDTTGLSVLGLLHTLWKTLGEELTRTRKIRASSPAVARRARRSLNHDEINVVPLRHVTYVDETPPGFPKLVNWSCRWWVGEFHRHIDPYHDEDENGRARTHKAMPAQRAGTFPDDDHDICAVCAAHGQTVRITLVRSFAKGPTDKPFRKPAPERTLYVLKR